MMNLNPYTIRLCCISAFFALFPHRSQGVPAQTKEAPARIAKHKKVNAIDIKANEITVDDEKQLATATGKVRILRGDTTLDAKRVVAYFSKNKKKKIERMEAFDDVKVVRQGVVVTANRGSYDLKEDVVMFEGDVVVSKGQNRLQGAYGIMNRRTGLTRILNHNPKSKVGKAADKRRVQALLISED